MLQDSPAPCLKEIIKIKFKKRAFSTRSGRFPVLLLRLLSGAATIALSPFLALRIPSPFPFGPSVLDVCSSVWCYSCKLAWAVWRGSLSSLSTALWSSPFFAVWKAVLVHMVPDSAYAYPLVFASLLLFVVELCFSAAGTVSAAEVCVRGILASHFSRRISPGNWKMDLQLTFPDVRIWLIEVGLWVVSVTVVILGDLTAGWEGLILKGLKISGACQNLVSVF